MNLLLLLSALLSALTGVGVGARAPQVAHVVEQRAQASGATVQVAAIAARPLAARLVPAASAAAPIAVAWRLAAPVPLYASRRRE